MQTKAWADNDRVRIQGSAAIVDAAIAAGVSRVVQESVSMLYRDGAVSGLMKTGRPTIPPGAASARNSSLCVAPGP